MDRILAWGYDIELLPIKWNGGEGVFFSAVFQREGDRLVFEISPRKNQLSELVNFLNQKPLLYGFNNHAYDDRVLEFLLYLEDEGKFDLEVLLKFSKSIFEFRDREKVDFSKNTIDLMTLTFQHKAAKSLKLVGVMLEHPKLSESKVRFEDGGGLERESLDFVCDHLIEYNINDVEITQKLWQRSQEKLDLRESTMQTYPDADLRSAYDSELAKTVVLNEYNKRSGTDASNLRTNRTQSFVKDLIPERIRFQDNDKYLEMLQVLNQWVIDFTKEDKQKFLFKSKAISHTVAAGGIHSNHPSPNFYKSGEYDLLDIDFGSYYPRIMTNFKVYPAHLDESVFLGILNEMTELRLELKALSKVEKDPVKLKLLTVQADRLKVVINSIYGLLGSETFFLFDQQARLQVCIIGQVLIMYMIYKIEELFPGTECIYSNTDGCTFKTKDKEGVKAWAEEFTKSLNFLLEFDEFEWAAIRDVSSYIIKKKNGKLKRKNDFEHEINLLQGYAFPIIPLAIEEYFVNGTDPEVFISGFNNIYKYCATTKFDKKSTIEWTKLENGEILTETLPKTLRWFICNKNSKLRKRDLYKGKIRVSDISAGYSAWPLFDVEDKEYDINKSFYIKEARKAIEQFNKTSLWQ